MALEIAFEVRSQQIKRQFWSRRQYRSVKIDIYTSNIGDDDYDGGSYEVLVPESALFDLTGDNWGPEYRRAVGEVTYAVWEDSPSGGGLGFVHGCAQRDTLALHLQPYLTEIEILGRIYVRAEPVGDYTRAKLTFPAFIPTL